MGKSTNMLKQIQYENVALKNFDDIFYEFAMYFSVSNCEADMTWQNNHIYSNNTNNLH